MCKKNKIKNLFITLFVSASILLNGCATVHVATSKNANPVTGLGALAFDIVTAPVQLVVLGIMNASGSRSSPSSSCTIQDTNFSNSNNDSSEDPLECVYGFIPNSEGFVKPLEKNNLKGEDKYNPVLNSIADFNNDILYRIENGQLESITINYDVTSNCNHIDKNKNIEEYKNV